MRSIASDANEGPPLPPTPATPGADRPDPSRKPTREVVLVASGVGKRYGERWVLEDANLTVERGTIVGIIGNNGAGKSTLLKMLCGLVEPTAGTVRLSGKDPTKPAARKALGFVPEDSPLFEEQTPLEAMAFFGRLHGVPSATAKVRGPELLRRLRLDENLWKTPVGKLSKGSARKLAIARALLHDPDVLLLDEPASGLDPATRRELDAFLSELRQQGKAILLSGHHLRQVEELCDSIILVHGGRIRASGTLAQLRSRWGGTTYRILATAATPGSTPRGALHESTAPDWVRAQAIVENVRRVGGNVVELEGVSPTLDEIVALVAEA